MYNKKMSHKSKRLETTDLDYKFSLFNHPIPNTITIHFKRFGIGNVDEIFFYKT